MKNEFFPSYRQDHFQKTIPKADPAWCFVSVNNFWASYGDMFCDSPWRFSGSLWNANGFYRIYLSWQHYHTAGWRFMLIDRISNCSKVWRSKLQEILPTCLIKSLRSSTIIFATSKRDIQRNLEYANLLTTPRISRFNLILSYVPFYRIC